MIVLVGTARFTSPEATVSKVALLDLLASELWRCSVAGGFVILSPAAMLVAATIDCLWSGPRREPTAVTVNLRPLSFVPVVEREVSSRRRTTSIAFSSSMIFGCLRTISFDIAPTQAKLMCRTF